MAIAGRGVRSAAPYRLELSRSRSRWAKPSLWRLGRKLGPLMAGALLVLLVAGTVFIGFFTNHVYVTTPSMYPTLPPGSMAFIEKSPNYRVGDIIEFHGNGLVFMHRIIRISRDGVITTKGDNPENAPDVFFPATTKADVIGKVGLGVHWIGFPELFVHRPGYALDWLRAELGFRGKLVVIGICGLIFSLSTLRKPGKARQIGNRVPSSTQSVC